MAKPKGSPKTGGRKKGTPNKAGAKAKEAFAAALQNYLDTGLFQDDLVSLKPADRLLVIIKMAKFIIPEPKSVDVSIAADTRSSLTDLLRVLSQEEE